MSSKIREKSDTQNQVPNKPAKNMTNEEAARRIVVTALVLSIIIGALIFFGGLGAMATTQSIIALYVTAGGGATILASLLGMGIFRSCCSPRIEKIPDLLPCEMDNT